MIGGVVGEDEVDRVPGKCIAAVVKNGLNGRAGEEPHGLAHRHSGKQIAETSTQCVQGKAFYGVVVQSAVCVWDVEAVVT